MIDSENIYHNEKGKASNTVIHTECLIESWLEHITEINTSKYVPTGLTGE